MFNCHTVAQCNAFFLRFCDVGCGKFLTGGGIANDFCSHWLKIAIKTSRDALDALSSDSYWRESWSIYAISFILIHEVRMSDGHRLVLENLEPLHAVCAVTPGSGHDFIVKSPSGPGRQTAIDTGKGFSNRTSQIARGWVIQDFKTNFPK